MCSIWNVLKMEWPFWNVIIMKAALFGMCSFWNGIKIKCAQNVPILEGNQNGTCFFWNIPFLGCDQNEMCPFLNLLKLNGLYLE